MRESLLITGTIAAVAITAAVVSAPSILNHAGAHPIPSIPVPSGVFPTTGPPAVIASPTELPSVTALPSPVLSSVVPERGSASSTAPAMGRPVAPVPVVLDTVAPTTAPPAPAARQCLIGLVLDPLLGICVG